MRGAMVNALAIPTGSGIGLRRVANRLPVLVVAVPLKMARGPLGW